MQKSKNKRYYGMTVSQIGILLGTAALLMCVAGAAFFFVLSSAPPAQPPAATRSIPGAGTMTSTPKVQRALTGTALTPTSTLDVSAPSAPPDGWVEFQTPGAALWLPPEFIGGDLVLKKEDTITKIARFGRYYRSAVDGIKRADQTTVLWMVDKSITKLNEMVIAVNARHIIVTEETSLDDYIKSYWDGNDHGTPVAMLFTLNETRKLTLLGREAKRVTYSYIEDGHNFLGLTYYIKDGAEIWAVNYLVDPDQYVEMLHMVEQSIKTFRLVK